MPVCRGANLCGHYLKAMNSCFRIRNGGVRERFSRVAILVK